MLLASLAFAYAPTLGVSWASDAELLRILTGPDGARLLSAGSTIEVRAADGSLEGYAVSGAADLAVTDLYDDGTVELLACTPEGLVALPWTSTGLGSPLTIQAEACTALLAVEGGFVVGGASSARWTNQGERSELPLVLGEGARMLERDGEIWAATPGVAEILRWDGANLTTYPLAETLGGLVTWTQLITWSLPESDRVQDEVGNLWELRDQPGALLASDLDLDGAEDLLVLHPDSVGWLLGSGGGEGELAGGGVDFAVGDLGGDCPTLAIADGSTIRLADPDDCASDDDADGDDYSLADGDCDDDDAAVHPGAAEACDGVDQDCDGLVDELGQLSAEADGGLYEGGETELELAWDGCDTPSLVVSLAGTRDEDCVADAEGVRCAWSDDGDVTISLSASTADGAAAAEIDLVVENLDPTLEDPGCGEGPWEVQVEEHVTDGIPVVDVPADTVSCFLLSGPPGLVLAGECEVDWTVGSDDIGFWRLQLLLMDEDGGAAEVSMDLDVQNSCGCSSRGCGESSAAGIGLLLAGWARRRRPGRRSTRPTRP